MKRGRIQRVRRQVQESEVHGDGIKLEHNPLWNIKADCAFPSATQNEINAKDAKNLIKNGCKLVSEGANMPSTLEATKLFLEAKIAVRTGEGSERGRRGHVRPRNGAEQRTA